MYVPGQTSECFQLGCLITRPHKTDSYYQLGEKQPIQKLCNPA